MSCIWLQVVFLAVLFAVIWPVFLAAFFWLLDRLAY